MQLTMRSQVRRGCHLREVWTNFNLQYAEQRIEEMYVKSDAATAAAKRAVAQISVDRSILLMELHAAVHDSEMGFELHHR